MSRRDLPHVPGCPVTRGADPDHCGCDDVSDGGAARPDADARPPWKRQQIDMSKLWSAAGVTRRPDRLALIGVLLERPAPESSRELTVGDADVVLARLRELETAGRLRAWAGETLAALETAGQDAGGGR